MPKASKSPFAFRVYVPPQLPELARQVEKAAEEASQREFRTVSVSEWIVRAIMEKLRRDAAAATGTGTGTGKG